MRPSGRDDASDAVDKGRLRCPIAGVRMCWAEIIRIGYRR